jgi:hypothetical protein
VLLALFNAAEVEVVCAGSQVGLPLIFFLAEEDSSGSRLDRILRTLSEQVCHLEVK